MLIVKNKKAECSIVLPKNPSEIELFASEELISYVEKISNAKLCNAREFENKIYVGALDSFYDNAFLSSLIEDNKIEICGEGFFILVTEEAVCLIGASSRNSSTLYAVYEFLERYLGLSLSAYGNSNVTVGEFIPNSDTIFIQPDFYVKKKEDLSYRTAIVQYDNWLGNPDHKLNSAFISWLSKNRYNRILTWSGIYEGYKKNGVLREAEKRGIKFSVGHHEAFNTFLPPFGNEYFSEKYRETHPEYFKLMENGERYKFSEGDFSEQLTLCMRNEDMIAEFSKNVTEWLSKNPSVDVICLWPQDGMYQGCTCPKCSKYSKSENYTYFVNEVATKVNEKIQGIKIDRIVYMDLTDCDSKSVSSSVIADCSVWLSDGLRYVGSKSGDTSYRDSASEKILLNWKDHGATAVYYDYLMGIYASRQRWIPMAKEIPYATARMKNLGIFGLGTQVEPFNIWNNLFNFFTYGRSAYDTSLTFLDCLERFSSLFGEGSEDVKEIILASEKILDGTQALDLAADYFINKIDKEFVYRKFDEALEHAKTPLARNNVRLLRMVFRYSDLETNSPRVDEVCHEKYSRAADENGELHYMHTHFDSYISAKEGYGIAIPTVFTSDRGYKSSVWYDFE
jgi:hypothetical protein